jgi:hypothetical protein
MRDRSPVLAENAGVTVLSIMLTLSHTGSLRNAWHLENVAVTDNHPAIRY